MRPVLAGHTEEAVHLKHKKMTKVAKQAMTSSGVKLKVTTAADPLLSTLLCAGRGTWTTATALL